MGNELNNENYFSQSNERDYMSYSQFKNFLECEAQGLAIAEGRYEKPSTKALLQGSYVDAYFSGEMGEFVKKHPDLFKKDGTLKSDFAILDEVIKSIEEDKVFHDEFYTGEAQKVLTGEITGVPFKGKIDFLYGNKIVDMKAMASVENVWSEEEHRKIPFYSFYKYDIQGAIYRELVRQATGKKLPYYLIVATKESPSKHVAYRFSDDVLDDALALVEKLAPRYQRIKNHEIEPVECGKCGYYGIAHKFDILDIVNITKEDM